MSEAGDGASTRMVEIALEYAAIGYAVLPVLTNSKRPAAPTGTWGATTDPVVVQQVFSRQHNIGILAPAEVLVLDVDDRQQVDRLEAMFPELAAAPRHDTPNGAHFFVRVPARWTMPTRTRALPDVDVRGLNRAYVVAPYSRVDDREYRIIRALVPPAQLPMASDALLAALHPTPQNHLPPPDLGNARRLVSTPYGQAAIDAEAAAVTHSQPGERNNRLNTAAYKLGQLVAGGEIATEAEVRGPLLKAALRAGLQTDEVERTIRSGLLAGAEQSREAPVGAPSAAGRASAGQPGSVIVDRAPNLAPDVRYTLLEAPLSDAGNAERIVALFGADWIHVPGLGDLIWRGTHWEVDRMESARQWGVETMRRVRFEAEHCDLPRDDRDRIIRHALLGENMPRLNAAVGLARGNRRIHVDARALDKHDDYLNVENGRLHLPTGTLHPHDRNAYETMLAPVRWDAEADHWAVRALRSLLGNDGGTEDGDEVDDVFPFFLDEERREHTLQQIAGASLSGRTEKRLWFLIGRSGTGKSTFAAALAGVLGPYAQHVEPTTLLESFNSAGGPRADLMKLRGARLVIAGELQGKLNEGLLKRMTGGDSISARGPHQSHEVSFPPKFTLLIHSNQRPKFDGLNDGMLARVAEIPFEALPGDPDLPVREELTEDPAARSAFLTWAVRGAMRWYAGGRRTVVPESVARATKAFTREMNPFAEWFEERVEATPDSWTSTDLLYEDFMRWNRAAGLREAPSKIQLGRWLSSAAGIVGGDAARRSGVRGFLGVHLRE
jgi:P4 family phage/plasmid primase-like protien